MIDPDNKSPTDQDFLDVEEFESDANEPEDFDDDNEEGIFAPTAPARKKSGGGLVATVAVAALLGGAAFYYYTNGMPQIAIPGLTSHEETPVAAEPPVVPEITADASSAVPPIPTPASDFDTPAPPPEVAPPTPDTAPTPEVAATPEIAPPVVAPPAENIADEPSVKPEEMPAPPTVEEAKAEVIPVKPPESAPLTPMPPVITDEKPAPDQAALAKAPEAAPAEKVAAPKEEIVLPKKNELEAARETVNVKKTVAPKMEYFDAPGSKALTDIPPPSINPMREPGESIIVVHKRRPAEDAIIERGDESGFIESKLISANRAMKLGRYDAALDFYNQLLKKNARDPRILMGRAVTLQKMGETQKAVSAYEDVLEVDSDNPEAITNLMGLIGKTKPAYALQKLLELREIYPKNASVAAQLGVAYTQSGNPEDGLKYLNIAAGLDPDNPLHYYNMAVIAEHLNDREAAIKYYEQALDTYSVNGAGDNAQFSRDQIYDRLARLRGN